MASCNLGGSLNLKVLSSYPEFNKCIRQEAHGNRFGRPHVFHGIRTACLNKKPFARLLEQPCTPSPFVVSCSTSQTAKSQPGNVFEEKKSISETSEIISSSEVQSLLTNICDTSTIAEFKLNLGGFRLYVKRDLDGESAASLPPALPPVHVDKSAHIPNSNGSASSTSLAISKSETSSGEIQRFAGANTDEGLVMLPSPKVGFFRRSRTIKGKRAPPPCKENQEVKEGQVLCYIEQLGGEIPIESDVSGEVVKIMKKDGDPVGYGDALIAILPSFPGIKKLQLPA